MRHIIIIYKGVKMNKYKNMGLVNIKKYIMEENDIKVSIGENVSLRKPNIINENVIVKLLSTRIKE